MITVAVCLYDGKDVLSHSRGIFTPEWVDKLYRGVKRNTTQPFRFVCFVDKDYSFKEDIEARRYTLNYRNMFCLLEPFQLRSDVLFMGLDTVIVGNIDPLITYRPTRLMMTRDPNNPKIGCSGVMMFPDGTGIWERFVQERKKWERSAKMGGYVSDMMFLKHVPHGYLDDMLPGVCVSYKVHVKTIENGQNRLFSWQAEAS